jgi:acetyl-CoA carboxylase biotin carboxyl carrier protein
VSLTGRDVAEILKALEQSSFDTLDLELNGVQIHLRRSGAPPRAETTRAAPVPAPPVAASVPPARPAAREAPSASRDDATAVPAPLLGIYYRAPKPGEAPFVQVGDHVAADAIIGIIEVMKLMNSVRAGVAGRIVEISAGNGELVEYGQPLLWIRPVT